MGKLIALRVRNFTGFDLSRSSYGLTEGRWGKADALAPPSELVNTGTATFESESVDQLGGTSGFAEYMAAAGTFRIEWNAPFIGNYSLNVTVPTGYEEDIVSQSADGPVGHGSGATSIKVILQSPE